MRCINSYDAFVHHRISRAGAHDLIRRLVVDIVFDRGVCTGHNDCKPLNYGKGDQVREKRGFGPLLYMLKMIVYQDRLGTNLGGKTPPKDVCFLTVGGLAPPGPLSRLLPRCGSATLVLHCRIIFVQKRFTVNLPRQARDKHIKNILMQI